MLCQTMTLLSGAALIASASAVALPQASPIPSNYPYLWGISEYKFSDHTGGGGGTESYQFSITAAANGSTPAFQGTCTGINNLPILAQDGRGNFTDCTVTSSGTNVRVTSKIDLAYERPRHLYVEYYYDSPVSFTHILAAEHSIASNITDNYDVTFGMKPHVQSFTPPPPESSSPPPPETSST